MKSQKTNKKVKNINTRYIIMVFENKNNISEISRFVLKDKRVFRNLQVLDKFRLHLVLYLVFNENTTVLNLRV
jgi:hypothetical protein